MFSSMGETCERLCPQREHSRVSSFSCVVKFCLLLLCSRNVLSVTIKESFFIDTNHWICFSECADGPYVSERIGNTSWNLSTLAYSICIFKIEHWWDRNKNYFESPKSSLPSIQFLLYTSINFLWIVKRFVFPYVFNL